jgi:hypothetical protein
MLEEHLCRISNAFGRGDPQENILLRFGEVERQETAARLFLAYELVDLGRGCDRVAADASGGPNEAREHVRSPCPSAGTLCIV